MLLSHLGMISAQTLTTLRSLVASDAAERLVYWTTLAPPQYSKRVRTWLRRCEEAVQRHVH